LRELLDQRDHLDRAIAEEVKPDGRTSGIAAGAKAERKEIKCSLCQQPGHTARTCPTKDKANGHAEPGHENTL